MIVWDIVSIWKKRKHSNLNEFLKWEDPLLSIRVHCCRWNSFSILINLWHQEFQVQSGNAAMDYFINQEKGRKCDWTFCLCERRLSPGIRRQCWNATMKDKVCWGYVWRNRLTVNSHTMNLHQTYTDPMYRAELKTTWKEFTDLVFHY